MKLYLISNIFILRFLQFLRKLLIKFDIFMWCNWWYIFNIGIILSLHALNISLRMLIAFKFMILIHFHKQCLLNKILRIQFLLFMFIWRYLIILRILIILIHIKRWILSKRKFSLLLRTNIYFTSFWYMLLNFIQYFGTRTWFFSFCRVFAFLWFFNSVLLWFKRIRVRIKIRHIL